jgi:2-amino-4-hydroxy-6-hydroxymethyldihydropteridine diphosphokinase
LKRTQHGIICFIGIGSNLEQPSLNCLQAIDRISSSFGVRVVNRSSLYWTEPVFVSGENWFVNAVVEIRTALSHRELLSLLQSIEIDMGRVNKGDKSARIIDLDILLYGQEVIEERDLVIPHPQLHKRRFVMVPLCEIAPYVIHPAFGISIKGLMDRLQDESEVLPCHLSDSYH